ncbi:MAG: hypothetical protein J2P41_11455, partial [Blastocatellia bacterium]|nr:hypothetical protein [Blastocatellia bacterium]
MKYTIAFISILAFGLANQGKNLPQRPLIEQGSADELIRRRSLQRSSLKLTWVQMEKNNHQYYLLVRDIPSCPPVANDLEIVHYDSWFFV